MLTKDDALAIAKKLKGDVQTGRKAHDYCCVKHDGKFVCRFGIRRGSSRDAGHDHIPNELHVSPRIAKGLAICTVSRDEWIHRMQEKNLL